jgi:hypothetical protein
LRKKLLNQGKKNYGLDDEEEDGASDTFEGAREGMHGMVPDSDSGGGGGGTGSGKEVAGSGDDLSRGGRKAGVRGVDRDDDFDDDSDDGDDDDESSQSFALKEGFGAEGGGGYSSGGGGASEGEAERLRSLGLDVNERTDGDDDDFAGFEGSNEDLGKSGAGVGFGATGSSIWDEEGGEGRDASKTGRGIQERAEDKLGVETVGEDELRRAAREEQGNGDTAPATVKLLEWMREFDEGFEKTVQEEAEFVKDKEQLAEEWARIDEELGEV